MIRQALIAGLLICTVRPALAQTPAQTPTPPAGAPGGPPPSGFPKMALRPSTPAELANVTIVRDVVYGHKEGVALIYDVYKPKKANGALVVNIVSAGWRSSWAPPEERMARYQLLLDKGFTVVALFHGSAPRFKVTDATDDVRRGMRHIKMHAKDYGADPKRIGVWGASAGGHLALVAGEMADDGDPGAKDPVLRQENHVRAVVAYYPPADMVALVGGRANRQPPLDFDDKLLPGISPIQFVDPSDPPTLIMHGDADSVVPLATQGQAMHAALDKAGVENVLKVFPGADHDFFIKGDEVKTDANAVEALKTMVSWFETHLK